MLARKSSLVLAALWLCALAIGAVAAVEPGRDPVAILPSDPVAIRADELNSINRLVSSRATKIENNQKRELPFAFQAGAFGQLSFTWERCGA